MFWIGKQAANRKMPYIEWQQKKKKKKDKNVNPRLVTKISLCLQKVWTIRPIDFLHFTM